MTQHNLPACSTRYHAAHDSGMRTLKQICYVVLHATEGETAEGAAVWFTNPASKGSANLICGDHICFKTVNDNVIPWAAPPLNTKGLHIEIVGFSHWTRAQWLQHTERIDNAAYRTALRCIWWRIPVQFITADRLKEGDVGITTHAEISKAFGLTNHTDPGEGFPMDWFLNRVVVHIGNGIGV